MVSEKKYWIALSAFFLFGPIKFKLLVSKFGTAENIWKASVPDLLNTGMSENILHKFDRFRQKFDINGYLTKLKKYNIQAVALYEKEYPKLLKEIPDPPYLLYFKAKEQLSELLIKPCIAVVGSRKISSYSRIVTEKLTRELVRAGFTIVSGLAYGVDTLAHLTSLESGGKTLSVVVSLDKIYPAQNSTLAQKIIETGALITEFPLGMTIYPGCFPIRNRLISGLCWGSLIIAAASKSGSLITARLAAEQGREVFAVPGPITAEDFSGTNDLIKKGAKAVTCLADILEEYPYDDINKEKKDIGVELSDQELKILEIIRKNPQNLDELAKISCISVDKLNSMVTILEIKGYITIDRGIVYYK